MQTARHRLNRANRPATNRSTVRSAIRATAPRLVSILGAVLALNSHAMSLCDDFVGAPSTVMSPGDALESIIFDKQGRMLLSNISKGAVWAVAAPGATPETLASGISTIGGLALGEGQDLYIGTGNGLNGAFPSQAAAALLKLDMGTGQLSTYAKGLAMANGVKRHANGTIYVSDDLASVLSRVTPGASGSSPVVEKTWIAQNSNGMAFSADGNTLFVNQTFPSKIKAIDLTTTPPAVRTVVAPSLLDSLSVFDGLAIDSKGNLLVAAWLTGKVLRASPSGSLCVLAQGLGHPSDVAIGSGANFANDSVFVITHGGKVFELPHTAK